LIDQHGERSSRTQSEQSWRQRAGPRQASAFTEHIQIYIAEKRCIRKSGKRDARILLRFQSDSNLERRFGALGALTTSISTSISLDFFEFSRFHVSHIVSQNVSQNFLGRLIRLFSRYVEHAGCWRPISPASHTMAPPLFRTGTFIPPGMAAQFPIGVSA
jgi:3-methyladenine DNA glycosylase/8-oxoguanine DNA glycosylase